MKKLITLLVIAAMCLSLTACIIVQDQGGTNPQSNLDSAQENTTAAQEETVEIPVDATEAETEPQTTEPASPLVGVWKRTVFFNTADLGLEGTESDFPVSVGVTFREDGTYSIDLDMEQFEAAVMDHSVPVLADKIYAEYAQQELSKEDADAEILAIYGMTVEDYARSEAELMDIASMVPETTTSGNYYLDGDKLYTDADTDSAEVYTILLGDDVLNFQRAEKSITWSVFRIPFPFMLARAEQAQ